MGFVDPLHNKYQTGGLQHLLARQIRQEVGEEKFFRCFRFTFVRNPWDKAVSQYTYMRERHDLRAFIGMREDDSFSRYLALIQERQHVQWMPQTDFLLDVRGNSLVEFVGRFERLTEDVREVFARLGLQYTVLPHRLRSRRGRYLEYYDQHTRKLISRLYGSDIEAFKYTFGIP
jgi:predicted phosphoadenosine phosphosulfate sulfurtransferase